MKFFIALCLLALSQVECKWDSHNDHNRVQQNGLERREQEYSTQRYNNWQNKRDNDRQYHTRQQKDNQIGQDQSTQRYNHRRDWSNRRENEQQLRDNDIEQEQSTPREKHNQDWLAHRENKHSYKKDRREHWDNHRELKQDWSYKRESNDIPMSTSGPPDHTELIPMARYVIHNADWASIATISTLPAIEGFPFSNVKSIVDGYIANSTGIPYFYMSPLDFTARDLKQNSRTTVLATLEETKFCIEKDYDAEDPRCTRVMLSGKMKKVKENSTEYEFAKGALFERHPSMANFPADHDFFVAKLKIAQIAMVDWFGGAKYIPVRDYLAYNFTEQAAKKFKDNHKQLVNHP